MESQTNDQELLKEFYLIQRKEYMPSWDDLENFQKLGMQNSYAFARFRLSNAANNLVAAVKAEFKKTLGTN